MPKSCTIEKARNVFFDDWGFPNDSDKCNKLLHNIEGGKFLQKKKFLTPPIDVIDPVFNWEYSNELHGDKLWTNLDISHLSPEHAAALLNVIKKYWCVFDKHGAFMTICNYECIIDTGTAAPIAIKKIYMDHGRYPSCNGVLRHLLRSGRSGRSMMASGRSKHC
jgi:hypothetical protein